MMEGLKYKLNLAVILLSFLGELIPELGIFVLACNSFSDYCDVFDESENVQTPMSNISFEFNALKFPYYENNTGFDMKSRQKRFQDPFLKAKETSNRVSTLLDELLVDSGYDKKMRPEVEGKPIQVKVNIAIRSMGPVDENTQTFQLDCYFRQYWEDFRLKFNGTGLTELPMNWQFLTDIWRPDTIIINGIDSYLHKITVPNRFIRISPEGRISYSQRLTLKARCKMDLRKFPLDKQVCSLKIGSFGYSSEEVVYRFSDKPLSWVNKDKLGLAQHYKVNWTSGSLTETTRQAGGILNKSTIFLDFTFQRKTGFFIIQIYIPLTLIVCCSWVQFWLTKTDIGGEIDARTTLGATTVLTVVTIGFIGKSKPQVEYATAHDVFVLICFFLVFAAVVEFACLNFLDGLIRNMKGQRNDYEEITPSAFSETTRKSISNTTDEEREEDLEAYLDDKMMIPTIFSELDLPLIDSPTQKDSPEQEKSNGYNFKTIHPSSQEDENEDDWDTIETTIIYGNGMKHHFIDENYSPQGKNNKKDISTENRWSVMIKAILKICSSKPSKDREELSGNLAILFDNIDHISSRAFPITFLIINIMYWVFYVYIL